MKGNDKSLTKLMLACKGESMDEASRLSVVLNLLDKHAKVNARHVHNNTELINARDEHDNTALMYAVISDYETIVDLLLRCGEDVNAHNFNYETPAILAARNNTPKILKELLDHGATNLERIDMVGGKNVYQYAAENSCKKVMDEFKKNITQQASEVPAQRSLLTRFFDVILYPFRLIGNIVKSIFITIGGAALQVAINKYFKRSGSADHSKAPHDFHDNMFAQMDDTRTITKLTSSKEPEQEAENKKKVGIAKQKKPTLQFENKNIIKVGNDTNNPNNNKPGCKDHNKIIKKNNRTKFKGLL